MKPRKHRHKESFSVLLISNTGQNSRQYHVTPSVIRLFVIFMLLLCVSFGLLVYQYLSGDIVGSVSVNRNEDKNAGENQKELLEQIAAQEQLVQKLEEENKALNNENSTLTSENKALLEAARANMGTNKESGMETQTDTDVAVPGRYPYSEQGVLSVKYSEDHPYVSIDTKEEGNIIAAGDGTVTSVGSDDTYPLIIEIDHGNGYRTRYMFLQNADCLKGEGDQVQTGDVLVELGVHNEQVDYQVISDGEPIDPLIVFEAKG